jgi:hypothetical protein
VSEKLYRPIVNEGTHLASSKGTEGAYRGALLDDDTNILAGQAEWIEVESYEKESDNELGRVIVLVVGIGIGVVVCKASPHVIRWWNNTVAPNAKKLWFKLIRKEVILKDKENILADLYQQPSDEVPQYVTNFNAALSVYLEALEKEELSIKIIDKLIFHLEELKNNYDDRNITINFSIAQLTTIMDAILYNINKITEKKLIKLEEFSPTTVQENTELGKLKHHLEVQKYILKEIA